MKDLKTILENKGHGILEMPSGTGKTIALTSLIVSYLHSPQGQSKHLRLIYLTRTVAETSKVHQELKRVFACIEQYENSAPTLCCLGISSRLNMCIHPTVSLCQSSPECDSRCRDRTASFVRDQADKNHDIETCHLFNEYWNDTEKQRLSTGVFSLDDLKNLGKERGICPYFLSIKSIETANVIVGCYAYMLDPQINQLIGLQPKEHDIIVFDEAHNIDNSCIDSLSAEVPRRMLDTCEDNIRSLTELIHQRRQTYIDTLNRDRDLMLQEIGREANLDQTEILAMSPYIPTEITQRVIPGSINNSEHFLSFLTFWVKYLKHRFNDNKPFNESPSCFLFNFSQVANKYNLDPLKFLAERLNKLFHTLMVTNLVEYKSLQQLCSFAALVSTHDEGFSVVMEGVTPITQQPQSLAILANQDKFQSTTLRLCCHDPQFVFRPICDTASSVIITSGTLSPLDMYPRLLGFTPVLVRSYTMSISRQCILPMVVTKSPDQIPLSTRFSVRNDPSIVRNFGSLLIEVTRIVPDGVVAFFPSYSFLRSILQSWKEMGTLHQLYNNKLVFVETPDPIETALALHNYQTACDCGRGGLFMCVSRGKVSEGTDSFQGHYGRCMICFGIPYINTESLSLRARLEYLRTKHGITEKEFLSFDAMRAASQCMGRVIRTKDDYGVMIMADKRFSLREKRKKFPAWIQQYLSEAQCNLSTEQTAGPIRSFLRTMGTPIPLQHQIGQSLWSLEHIGEYNEKEKQRILQEQGIHEHI
ncbi:putative General transcription and DNA repair factor IIH helicase subunit XPD [Blattamonas nauphoetae]|uniref:DNA 5'-3' helicase n=1 Tax=Blattamonas nauphoetae TaxID=2049346 RepID=A0ABQ9XLR4_9EUKA|nr:putative General transcription and DNA repair factor IIH helicase subunit XPD [Blattamonas nauphoetae]